MSIAVTVEHKAMLLKHGVTSIWT